MSEVTLAHSYSSIKMFENCPKRYFHQRITKEVKDEGGEASIYGDRIHKQLEARLVHQTPLPEESARYEPLCRAFEALPGTLVAEQEYTLTQELKPTGWWDSDAWLRSKLDVLVIHNDTAVVGDWKTGKRRPDFDQLELFALQVFKHHPEVQRVKSSFVWLKDWKMDHQTYTRIDATSLWNKLFQKISRIEQALQHENWPAKPSGLCPWCPAKNICPYANV